MTLFGRAGTASSEYSLGVYGTGSFFSGRMEGYVFCRCSTCGHDNTGPPRAMYRSPLCGSRSRSTYTAALAAC